MASNDAVMRLKSDSQQPPSEQLSFYQPNYNSSNISEINESDLPPSNFQLEQSLLLSPREQSTPHAGGLQLVQQQMASERIRTKVQAKGTPQVPPTTAYSSSMTKPIQRYGTNGGSQWNGPLSTDAEATTMASQLESQNSKCHQSKFSQYEDGLTPQQAAKLAAKAAVGAGTPNLSSRPNFSRNAPVVGNVGPQPQRINFNYAHVGSAGDGPQKSQRSLHMQPGAAPQLRAGGANQYAFSDVGSVKDQQRLRTRENTIQPPSSISMKQPQVPFFQSAVGQGSTPGPVGDGSSVVDFPDILDEKFASPRVTVKKSQPLLSKNSFISYLNKSTLDIPMSPKPRRSDQPKTSLLSSKLTAPTQGGLGLQQSAQVPAIAIQNNLYMQSEQNQSIFDQFSAMHPAQPMSPKIAIQQHQSHQHQQQPPPQPQIQLDSAGTMGAGVITFSNFKDSDVMKQYMNGGQASNSEVQPSRVMSPRVAVPPSVTPRHINFDAPSAVQNLNGSFVSEQPVLTAQMSLGSSQGAVRRGAADMMFQFRGAKSPTMGVHNLVTVHNSSFNAGQTSIFGSPQTPHQADYMSAPLNDSIGSDVPAFSNEVEIRDIDSRQSQAFQQVIGEYAQKYSTIVKKRRSINPRRQKLIVRVNNKRQASRAADCQLSPRLPDCFLIGPHSRGSSLGGVKIKDRVDTCATAEPLSPNGQEPRLRGGSQQPPQKSSQLSHISSVPRGGVQLGQPRMMAAHLGNLQVNTGNSILQSRDSNFPQSCLSPGMQQVHPNAVLNGGHMVLQQHHKLPSFELNPAKKPQSRMPQQGLL